MTIELTISLDTRADALLICPMGLSTPHLSTCDMQWDGGNAHVIADPTTGQQALAIAPTDATVKLVWSYVPGGAAYPETMFVPRSSRYLRAAEALVAEARQIVTGAADPIRTLADHVARQFTYGHPDTRYYDGLDEIPQLCSIAEGSCVDINAYFIAACRAAGFEAGYITGCFIPAEKRTHCNDMHCWVVTRCAHGIREWDIAHHLKMGTRDIQPGLNPKPGVRAPFAHSMGLNFPSAGIVDLKLLGEPMWRDSAGIWHEANPNITFTGYDQLG